MSFKNMNYSTRIVVFFLMNLSLFSNLNAKSYSYLESEPPSLELEKSHVFIDGGVEYDAVESRYVYIIPIGRYTLLRTVKTYDFGRRRSLSVIESINKEKTNKRYQLDQGFVFFRTNDDNSSRGDTEIVVNNVVGILNHEANDYGVYFYDFKDSFVFENALDVFCEGKIFSPSRGSAHGYFFFRKLKPAYGSEACYLIYYGYTAEYDAAKNEFDTLCDCIYIVSEGCLKKYSPQE